MTIQDLGSIGEAVGAIATVATLIYLAVQIRRNTRAVQSAAAQSARDAHSTHSCLADLGEIESADSRAQVWIESAEFIMGDSSTYPEEGPAHKVSVAGFWIDTHEVTNGQFAKFVEETGYVTGIREAAMHARRVRSNH